MITKPIDLIVANTMHESVSAVAQLRTIEGLISRLGGKTVDDFNVHNEIARKLLCSISHEADMAKVFVALLAVGAPCTAEDIAEGLRAVKERAR